VQRLFKDMGSIPHAPPIVEQCRKDLHVLRWLDFLVLAGIQWRSVCMTAERPQMFERRNKPMCLSGLLWHKAPDSTSSILCSFGNYPYGRCRQDMSGIHTGSNIQQLDTHKRAPADALD
jgi:hypothetical protein